MPVTPVSSTIKVAGIDREAKRLIVTRDSMFFLVNLHLWCCSGKVDEKATQLHAIASLKVLLDATRPHNGAATSTAAHYSGASSRETTLQLQQGSQGTTTTTTTTTTTAGTTAGIQELPNGGIAAGLDAGLDSVIVKFDECLIASISSFRFLRPSSNSPKFVLFLFRSRTIETSKDSFVISIGDARAWNLGACPYRQLANDA